MKISETPAYSLSFEMFPPKKIDQLTSYAHVASEIASLHPSFMSVTYGAGGGTSDFTLYLTRHIQDTTSIPAMAHLSCITSSKEMVMNQLERMQEFNIDHVLALRGDLPDGMKASDDFNYAIDLIEFIHNFDPSMQIAAACYPDVHPESTNLKEDIRYTKHKIDAGADFLITQLFFDNANFYNYMYHLREAGVSVPVHPGVMPLTNVNTIKKTLNLTRSKLPEKYKRLIDTFGNNPLGFYNAGVIYAVEQIIDLFSNGFKSVHVYSMNDANTCNLICSYLHTVLGCTED